ncbi:MAG TPA: NAD(P)-dependent oxidoreductase [Nitrososphaerales archaeon]|nr:NAD(P)-dependent oxidoreductase [Nitrososphaerales archaeon]
MRKNRAKLLVAQTANRREELVPLERYADIYWLEDMDEEEQARVLPVIDCVYSHGWPKALDAAKVSRMKSLRLYQAGNAGVNGIRFDLLDEKVVICSNAGSYSDEVAEFAIGLMLVTGKSIIKFDRQLRAGVYARQRLDDLGRQVAFFRAKTIGIVGYGGIGRSTARLAKPFGMKVIAFGRHPVTDKGVRSLSGRTGLMRLLRESDVVVLAVPLTNATRGLIGKEELAAMRPGAALVNVARGEVVQKEAIYDHLVKNPGFVYATDVWWPDKQGAESFSPDLPFLELDNFVGTPHASGPSAIISGKVGKGVVENLTRYFKGQPLKNVVDRSEYS